MSSDTGVLTTARLVLTLAEAAGVGEEARRIDIRDAQGVQVGDQNRQYNNVGTVVEAEYAQTVTAYSGTAVGVQGGSAYVGARRTDGSAGPADPRPDDLAGRLAGGAWQQVRAEGGFAYAVQGADMHLHPDRGPVYLLWDGFPPLARSGAPRTGADQPSVLLDARHCVVTFTGRDQELAELAGWRDGGEARWSALWLHAPGGQGKSRLAAEFAARSRAAGWKVVSAAQAGESVTQPPDSQDLRPGDANGILVVVDYADRWPASHLAWLFSNALFHQALPTRLLLLARSAAGWQAVRAALRDRDADTRDLLLGPADNAAGIAGRERMFAIARDCFAPYYGLADAGDIAPPVPLSSGGLGLTLAVHMGALAAVDARARGVAPPGDVAALSAYLLDRERGHWTRLYENRAEGLDYDTPPSTMGRAVFTAALAGAAPYAAGAGLLDRVAAGGRPDRVLADHRTCYPPADQATVLEPLYPDRLAEDFLALSLPGHRVTGYPADPWAAAAMPALAARSSGGAPPPHASRTIAFLAAAAYRWPHVAVHLAPVLRADPALAVAAGGDALRTLADVDALDITILEAVDAHFPPGSYPDLDVGIAAVATRVTRHRLATAASPADRGRLHDLLALRLRNAGRYDEAAAEFGEAIRIWTELAEADPAGYLPYLASARQHRGSVLAEAGRHGEALDESAAGAGLWRQLADRDPGSFGLYLVGALSSYAGSLHALERTEEALAVAAEATALHRSLEDAIRDRGNESLLFEYNSLYGLLYANSSNYLAGAGRAAEALEAAENAAAIYRRGVELKIKSFVPLLARTLGMLAARRRDAGQIEGALAAGEESTVLYRRLADANPAAYLLHLASAQSILVTTLSEADRHEDALVAAREAVSLWRTVAASAPAQGLPRLAAALDNTTVVLWKLRQTGEALETAQEAVTVYRAAERAQPGPHLHGLAFMLDQLGVFLWEFKRLQEALTVTEEAARILRTLARDDPAKYAGTLARTLDHLALRWWPLGQTDRAVEAGREAVGLYRRLAADDAAQLPRYADALNNLLVVQAESGDRSDDALATGEEAVAASRRLAEADPASLPGLARALTTLAGLYAVRGRTEEARAPGLEAIEIDRRLVSEHPGTHLPSLARALWMFAHAQGAGQEALDAVEEAAAIYAGLTAAAPALYAADLQRVGVLLTTVTEASSALPQSARRRRTLFSPRRDPR